MSETSCPTLPEWGVPIMALFSNKKTALTSQQVLEKIDDKVSRNAINQRLERLRDLDFLTRIRVGRWWEYRRA